MGVGVEWHRVGYILGAYAAPDPWVLCGVGGRVGTLGYHGTWQRREDQAENR